VITIVGARRQPTRGRVTAGYHPLSRTRTNLRRQTGIHVKSVDRIQERPGLPDRRRRQSQPPDRTSRVPRTNDGVKAFRGSRNRRLRSRRRPPGSTPPRSAIVAGRTSNSSASRSRASPQASGWASSPRSRGRSIAQPPRSSTRTVTSANSFVAPRSSTAGGRAASPSSFKACMRSRARLPSRLSRDTPAPSRFAPRPPSTSTPRGASSTRSSRPP